MTGTTYPQFPPQSRSDGHRRPFGPPPSPRTPVRFWTSMGGPEARMPFTQLSRALSYGQSSYNLQELIQIVECLLKPVKSRVTQFRSK